MARWPLFTQDNWTTSDHWQSSETELCFFSLLNGVLFSIATVVEHEATASLTAIMSTQLHAGAIIFQIISPLGPHHSRVQVVIVCAHLESTSRTYIFSRALSRLSIEKLWFCVEKWPGFCFQGLITGSVSNLRPYGINNLWLYTFFFPGDTMFSGRPILVFFYLTL